MSININDVGELESILLDRNDGPVTEFTAIHRAVELIKNTDVDPEAIANALYESLKTIGINDGRISSNEFNR